MAEHILACDAANEPDCAIDHLRQAVDLFRHSFRFDLAAKSGRSLAALEIELGNLPHAFEWITRLKSWFGARGDEGAQAVISELEAVALDRAGLTRDDPDAI
jgi:hypothetical protein